MCADVCRFSVPLGKRRAESASPFCSMPVKKPRGSVCPAVPQESRPRCRKRPNRPDPLDSVPEPKKAPAGRAAMLSAARDSSGATSEEKKRLTAEVNHSATDDLNGDNMSAFNSFQFWRVPLPELDLSLLDSPDNGGAENKDSTETMET